MASEKKAKKSEEAQLHDDQTTASAEALRSAVANVRGGMTQNETETFLRRIEEIASDLEKQGKSPEELEQERKEAMEQMTDEQRQEEERKMEEERKAGMAPAELVRESFDAEDPRNKEKNITSPGIPKPALPGDLGKPANVAQPTTDTRNAAETAALKGDTAATKASPGKPADKVGDKKV